MRQEDYPLVLTTEDIMEILQCGREKAYEYARSKGFPRLEGSRKIRVPRDAFFEWLAAKAKPKEEDDLYEGTRRPIRRTSRYRW